MSVLIAFPVLFLCMMLQTSVISYLPLLSGYADLPMVVIVAWALQERTPQAWVWGVIGGIFFMITSSIPPFVPLVSYLAISIFANTIRRYIWQSPLLTMFFTVMVGTIFQQLLTIVAMKIFGSPLPWVDSFRLVMLPSIMLNLLISIPVFSVMSDLASSVYPVEGE